MILALKKRKKLMPQNLRSPGSEARPGRMVLQSKIASGNPIHVVWGISPAASSFQLGQRVTRAASATSVSNEDAPFDKIGNVAQCRVR